MPRIGKDSYNGPDSFKRLLGMHVRMLEIVENKKGLAVSEAKWITI